MVRRLTRIFWEVTGIIALGAILFTGIATWRLSQGPVSINFLTSHIESALNGFKSPFKVKVKETNLIWAGWGRNLDIRLIDASVTRENGDVVAKAPEISIEFSLPALIGGTLAPTKLEFIRPTISLFRNHPDNLIISLGREKNLSTEIFDIIAAMNAMKKNNSNLKYLRQISVVRAKLEIDDKVSGFNWYSPKVDFVFLQEDEEIKATLFSEVQTEKTGSHIIAQVSLKSEAEAFETQFKLKNFPVKKIVNLSKNFKFLQNINLLLTGEINTKLSLIGGILKSNFNLSSNNSFIKPDKLWPGGLDISNFELSGTFDSAPKSLEIEKLNVNLFDTKVRLSGTVIELGQGISAAGRARINSIGFAQLRNSWPPRLATAARKWVISNIQDGKIKDIETLFSIRIPDLDNIKIVFDSLSGKLLMENATIRFHKYYPSLKKVNATAVFSKDQFIAKISSGFLRNLRVMSGKVNLVNLGSKNDNINIETTLSGPLKTALFLLDNKPFRFLSKFGLSSDSVKGWTKTNLKFSFPITDNLDVQRIRFSSNSRVINASLPNNPLKEPIQAGNFDLNIDKKGLNLMGNASVNGSEIKISWKENFSKIKLDKRQIRMSGKFHERLQKRILNNIPVFPYIKGPMQVDISLAENWSGKKVLTSKILLSEATLKIPKINWKKPRGELGVVWVSAIVRGNGEVEVRNLDLKARELQAKTSFHIDHKGILVSAVLHKIKTGRSDFSGNLKKIKENDYELKLNGKSLDLEPFLSPLRDGSEIDLPNFRLTAKVGTVWLEPNVPVDKLIGKIKFESGFIQKADLRGRLQNKQPFLLIIDTVSDEQNILLQTKDAGKFFTLLKVTKTVKGGTLKLNASRKKIDGAPWKGNITVKNYTVVKAPVLARMLTLASLTGILNRSTGKGISFKKLNIPFAYLNGKLKIHNARAIGDSLGLQAEGYVNFYNNKVNLEGTMVPGNLINVVLRKVPIVGPILTGKSSTGIFATKYKYLGTLDNPEILVAPLSILAPGVLRDIFDLGGSAAEPRGLDPNK